jgi:hypothetical protein
MRLRKYHSVDGGNITEFNEISLSGCLKKLKTHTQKIALEVKGVNFFKICFNFFITNDQPTKV